MNPLAPSPLEWTLAAGLLAGVIAIVLITFTRNSVRPKIRWIVGFLILTWIPFGGAAALALALENLIESRKSSRRPTTLV